MRMLGLCPRRTDTAVASTPLLRLCWATRQREGEEARRVREESEERSTHLRRHHPHMAAERNASPNPPLASAINDASASSALAQSSLLSPHRERAVAQPTQMRRAHSHLCGPSTQGGVGIVWPRRCPSTSCHRHSAKKTIAAGAAAVPRPTLALRRPRRPRFGSRVATVCLDASTHFLALGLVSGSTVLFDAPAGASAWLQATRSISTPLCIWPSPATS